MVEQDFITSRNNPDPYRIWLINSLLLLSLLVAGIAEAANITVRASRNPVSVDDSFHLIYEADSSVDDPDFSPVYNHFDVLSSSQSTNMRSINGNWSLKKSWDLTVIAKDVGRVTIPPISFGNERSPAINISVTNSTSAQSTSPDGQATIPAKIFLVSSVDRKSGWVQSQFIYTIKLFRTVNISGASIDEPGTSDPDTIVQALGEDSYQTTRNGIRYEVIERRYAIFPQRSGKLTINPAIFEGRIQSTQPRNIFDSFRMSGQMKRLRSKAIDIDVKPAPADINLQDWLPATQIQMVEEWSADLQQLKVGEPVTRTITIAADGLSSIQIPDIDIGEVDGLKQYPDKAAEENRQARKVGITGLKQIKVAIIPSRAGQFTLPEIRLNWWNTKTGKQEVTTLPDTTLTVSGTASTASTAAAETPAIAETSSSQSAVSPQDQLSSSTGQDSFFWIATSLFFATAWLLTMFLYFRKQPSRSPQAPADESRRSSSKASSAVEKAAGKNDARATRTALIRWAQLFYNDSNITSLSQIADRCSTELADATRQLNQALYSGDDMRWKGSELRVAFDKEKAVTTKSDKSDRPALKPLYDKSL